MYSSVNQNDHDDDEEQLLQEVEGAEALPHHLASVILDLQEKVALMSKELHKVDENQKKTEEQQKKTEEQIALISNNPKTRGIDEDTFSIMMTSKVRSVGWVLGLGTFAFQMTLVVVILIGYFQLSKDSTPFNAPIRVTNEVRIGQCFAVVLSLLSQKDLLNAIESMIAFRSSSPANKNESGFYRLLVDDDDDDDELGSERQTWFVRAILPNCLKLIQGLSVLIISLIVIVRSDELIGLLRDFTALYFLSEIDNIVFRVASQGYFGENLKARTEKVKTVNLRDETTTTSRAVERFARILKIFFLFALAAGMFSYLGYVMKRQLSGKFVKMKYPDCIFNNTAGKEPLNIGDNTCDGVFNNAECGFDGNDCEEFNSKYPSCPVADTTLVGDGFCNGGIYDTLGCISDGGDCGECSVRASEKDTRAIATGDFDNDSYEDIVFGNCGLSNQLLLNNGDGSFGNATDLPGGNYNQCTTAIAAGDFDGDGLVDIVVGRQQVVYSTLHRNNTILWNKGNGTFIEQHLVNSDVDTQAIEVVDLNNDSFPEIIFGNSKGFNNKILWNQGNKIFIESEFPGSGEYDTRSIAVVPDDAGDSFIFFGNYKQQNLVHIYNTAQNPGALLRSYLLGTREGKTIAMTTFVYDASDFNSFSIIALNEGGDHDIAVGTFSYRLSFSPLDGEDMNNKARCIETSDMINDGFVEFVTGHDVGESNRVLFLSIESYYTYQTLAMESSIELPCTSAMNTNAIALADLDNDGNIDIIMGNSMQMNQVLLNFLGDGRTYKQSGNNKRSAWLHENTLATKYPDCEVEDSSNIGDGICNIYDSNTEACGFDGGDCDEFNANGYPDCTAEHPSRIGDGDCDNYAPYNTEACGYDGGDCGDFNAKYPDCTAEPASFIGDGFCDNNAPYNMEACGYDGGDCLP